MTSSGGELTDEDYSRLLELRDGLRRFLHWSEQQAREAGITPAQHQLLLAVRGHPGGRPTLSDSCCATTAPSAWSTGRWRPGS